MIVNEQQYRATEKAITDLQNSLAGFNEFALIEAGIDPLLVRAQRSSIQAAIGELTDKLEQYDLARRGDEAAFQVQRLEDVGAQLIAARIANGWTQKSLAERLGLKEQQVQRYEKERYRMASLERLSDVARVLGVRLEGKLSSVGEAGRQAVAISEFISATDISSFPIAEMRKRRWLGPEFSRPRLTDGEKRLAVQRFFADAGLRHVTPMLHSRTRKSQDERVRCALLAWQARVKHIAREQPHSEFKGVTAKLIQTLARLSSYPDGPIRAVEILRKAGVIVVFEGHLEKTLLDGAAMLLEDGTPVIGMTLRQNRVDNFWHVLLHELGHIARHRNCGLAEGFLDQEDDVTDDPREAEATDFSRNALIPDELWKTSFVRYATTRDQIADFAKGLGIGPEVVAGRLRFERDDFAALSTMVGSGKVKKMFRTVGLFLE